MDNEPTDRLSRRQFLALTGVVGMCSARYALELKRNIANAAWSVIRDPAINNSIYKMADRIAAGRVEKNPEFRGMQGLIHNALSIYSITMKKKAHFRREVDYRDAGYYADNIRQRINERLISTPADITRDLYELAPEEARLTIIEADNRQQQEDLMQKGSGFFNRFKNKYPELFKNGMVTNYTQYLEKVRSESRFETESFKAVIEKLAGKEKKPVSTSQILALYLIKNDGDLGMAVTDTYLILKYIVRFDKEIDWFSKNIKDEFQGSNFNVNEKDKANLVGKAYHSWAFVHLLRYFPVEVVRLGGLARQLSTYQDQGFDKTVSDGTTLNDLRKIDGLLMSYNIQKPVRFPETYKL